MNPLNGLMWNLATIYMYKVLLVALLLLPISSSAFFDRDLYYGLTGTDVAELQELLADQGHFSATATGNFFTLTKKAVQLFQASKGIVQTGYFGPLTRAAANALLTNVTDETGTVISPVITPPKTNDDVIAKLNEQMAILLAQLNELKQNQATLQVNQESQSQVLGAIQTNTTPLPPPPPPPAPIVIPKPVPAKLLAEPTLIFQGTMITGIVFATDKEVVCGKDASGTITEWGTNCSSLVPNQSRNFYGDCNAPWQGGYFIFVPGSEYTCQLELAERTMTNKVPFTFTFTAPL